MTASLLTMLPALLGLLVAVLSCAALVAVGARMVARRRRLVERGVPVRAAIVSVRARSVAGGGFSYIPTVRYQLYGRVWDSVPEDGLQLLKTGTVMQTRGMADRFLGQALDVFVDPELPSRSAVWGRSRLGTFLVVVGCVFGGLILVIGLLGVVLGLVTRL